MQSQPPPGPSVPPHVLAASRAVLDLHDPALPVAALAADSLLNDALPRPEGAERRLLFLRDGLCVDVSLWRTPTGARLHVLVGPYSPDGDAEPHDSAGGVAVPIGDFLELVQPPNRTKVALSDGEARLADVPSGLTSLVLHGQVGSSALGLRTAWFTV
jgi:hypothetical protein